jgi:low temperature requirement protein LtrA
MELFSDLVYVVAVTELAGLLTEEVTAARVLAYVGLFVPVWWAWAGQTFYANRFDTDDTSHRLLAAVQIVAVAGLAASVHAVADRSAPFVLSYIGVRLLLIGAYVRAGRHVPEARPLCLRYAIGFSLEVALWAGSLLMPTPARFVVWAVAVAVGIGTPLTSRHYHAVLPPQPEHLPERFGLFVVIVLGESIASVVHGLVGRGLAAIPLIGAGAGVLLAASLWWLYFENIEESVVLQTRVAGQVWVYTHLPLVIAIAAVGVGVRHSILSPTFGPAERWLLGGSVAATLGLLPVLHACSRQRNRKLPRLAGVALALLATASAAAWPALALLVALAVICIAQVAVEIVIGGVDRPHEQATESRRRG